LAAHTPRARHTSRGLVMSAEESLLTRTGQMWKLRTLEVGAWTSLVIMAGATWFQLETKMPSRIYGAIAFLAAIIASASLIAPYSIRCPRCRTRWFWLAINTSRSRWHRSLKSQSLCQVCGYTVANPRER
jgi:hypothetical protein